MNETLAKLLRKLYGIAETGASTYAGTQQPYTAEQAKGMLSTMADFTPVVGDVKSAYEGIQAAREGDYVGAGLGALGALPMVPNMAGWTVHKMGDIKILENPTREMVQNLADRTRYGDVRGLVDPDTGKQYWWDGGILHHKDVADWLGLNWDKILSGSDRTRMKQSVDSIKSTPWKFAED